MNFESSDLMRIRYMAVDQYVQGKGIGKAILQRLLEFAKKQHAKRCWLRAREPACDFYRMQGFTNQGVITSELDIPHFRMEINL